MMRLSHSSSCSRLLQLSFLMTASRFSSLNSLVAHAAYSKDAGAGGASWSQSTKLPSSLHGSAIRALVEPGRCQFDDTPKAARLLSRTQVSPTSYLLRFILPDQSQPLQLTTCACILAHASMNGEMVTRPYTPVSTNAQVGSFDLLIKDYTEFGGVMSNYLCRVIQPSTDAANENGAGSDSDSTSSHSSRPSRSRSNSVSGDYVSFTHGDANVKISATDELIPKCRQLVLIAGGTGITPMLQTLNGILGGPDGPDRVTLLYGSKSAEDILAKQLLDEWTMKYQDRLDVVYVLSDEPKDSDWQGRRGMIDQKVLQEYLPQTPSSDIRILVCGPPPLYKAICGPRDDKDKVEGVLGDMGYPADQVYKF